MNSIQKHFDLDEDDFMIIPFNGCPTSFHTIIFEGWKGIQFSAQDETFQQVLKLASKTCKLFIDMYKKDHAFCQPQFCYKPNGTFYVKIEMMEKKRWEELYK